MTDIFISIRWRLPVLLALLVVLTACRQQAPPTDQGRLRVVTTLFPLYDFVRVVGGDFVAPTLLLPPGVEPHGFEPKPEDLLAVAKADLFVYTNPEMEPWAEKLASTVARAGKPLQLEAGAGAHYLDTAGEADGHRHEGERRWARDPHIWLDIRNAEIMVDNIAAALTRAAPERAGVFRANAAAYKKQLADLDARFASGLAQCGTREFVHGGHYAFAYLAERYHLRYIAAFGISAESEPSPRKIMELVETLRRHDLRYLFYEELLSPQIAQTVATEAGARLLKLYGINNLTKDEMAAGASYLSLMERNLASLREGLTCR